MGGGGATGVICLHRATQAGSFPRELLEEEEEEEEEEGAEKATDV